MKFRPLVLRREIQQVIDISSYLTPKEKTEDRKVKETVADYMLLFDNM
jgi:hypothetical protein